MVVLVIAVRAMNGFGISITNNSYNSYYVICYSPPAATKTAVGQCGLFLKKLDTFLNN